MKYLLSTILILSILSFQFSDLLIFVSFKINQDYIAKNLCVEKDIEDSTCKGCCQLKKQLEKNTAQKDQVPPTQNNKQNIDFISCNYKVNLYFPVIPEIVTLFFFDLKFLKFLSSIFHPPKISF